MAEEHRCQAPRLCANNCGFFGNPAMQDLCSKCYRDLQLKEQQSSNVKLALNQTLASSSSSSSAAAVVATPLPITPSPVDPATSEEGKVVAEAKRMAVAAAAQPQVSRCSACRRRVGLTGFNCRCGMTFCGSHRYPEQHACGFDFKAMGRDQISKANPVVKADKLNKI
ncbi:hypothetical protein SAY86_002476 [Trapa natans]|uniref:Zinc finger A20 and AN1 domain-containing stress-associated protein 3 n=1 Tax=Trapa natans TaxID=22666 RepID=A0AAN7LFR1_TRANT|nr:hypothetical protein SAY86_002476 [Trapa natans]